MKRIALCHPDGKYPVRSTPGSSGLDIFSRESHLLQAGTRHLFMTGLKIQYSHDLVMKIDPRSKLANKYGIQILAGVGDSDYLGEYGVILYNSGSQPLQINIGDPIAQIIFYQADQSKFEVVDESQLLPTERGERGILDAATRLY